MFEGERALGATFDPATIGWIDFESRNPVTDLRAAGAYRYATDAIPIICSYAIGDGPVHKVTRWEGLRWRDMPVDFRAHWVEADAGRAKWAAFNAGFDKSIWNYATDFKPLAVESIIDVQCQIAASGFPPDLAKASLYAGGTEKRASGKELIKLFCLPDSTATPHTHSGEWIEFVGYAGDDVEAMRDLFKRTRQLSLAEWQEYWAMERINERGIPIDLTMVAAAAKLADVDRVRTANELNRLTNGQVTSVDQVARLTEWLIARLGAFPDAMAIMTKRDAEVDDEGNETRPVKYQLTRRRVQALLVFVQSIMGEDTPGLGDVERLLQMRLYGGSKTPQKYAKMLGQHVDGTLFGQYVFNGAGQTGRASSRGVQVHNLARDTLEYEYEAIEALIADGRPATSYDEFAAIGDSTPVSRKLSLLIRPAFVPDPGHVFVWSDWSQIEARVLPWLAGDDPGALARLKIFRDVDANPKLPDLYTRTAADLSRCRVDEVTKPMRQRGKVAELALGFRGGVGALQNMAAGYGLHLPDDEAQTIVDRWREANQWNETFSRLLWEAQCAARDNPGEPFAAGRITFVYMPHMLGSLLMILPSGRLLTYRNIKWDNIDVLDDDDQPTGEKKLELMCSRGHGRIKLWPGHFVENATQAVAADVLRGTLRRLVAGGADVRLHTHDEILLQVKDNQRDIAHQAMALQEIMRRGFDWSDGLPLMSEERVEGYYTKTEP